MKCKSAELIAGSDEVGKGDYFGYLVVACVCCEEERLRGIGVRDSKLLSEAQILRMSAEIKKRCACEIVSLSPKRYNQLHRETGGKYNLNEILGWMHAKAITEVLKKCRPSRVAVDKFGKEEFVLKNLGEETRAKTVFITNGGRDAAIAAASIVARAEFLRRHEQLSRKLGVPLPRGSTQVISFARELVKRHGANALEEFAKLHFSVTREVLRK